MNAKVRGVRTALQAIGSVLIGLVVTVWSVEGVPQAVFNYLSNQAILFFGTTGVAGFVIGYLMNRNKR